MAISRVLCLIAGVDYDTLARCPRTDRLWAAHLGFSLILSFFVVSAITYNAISYVAGNPTVRLLVSVIVALTVFMFDRALYQADWFLQPTLDKPGWTLTRGLRIAFRLGISLCISFALALFLELAIFSDTITERLQDDFRESNAALFDKATKFEEGLDAQIAGRRQALFDAESSLAALNSGTFHGDNDPSETQAKLLQVMQQISLLEEDKNAELYGRKTRPGQTGVAGRGPAYHFAEAQIGSLRAQEAQLRETITAAKAENARLAASAQAEVDKLRRQLAELVSSRAQAAATFRQTLVEGSSEYQKQRNDPLARMQAYSDLKRDPVQGRGIVIFSWLVLLFVSFLEVVPVAAKMLFCPPSVYGSIIKAEVLRERRRAERVLEGILYPNAGLVQPTSEAERIRDVREVKPRKRPIPEIVLKKRDLDKNAVPANG
jgi:hypothetical protein